tara:strand:- start:281 stop:1126 length:846 start_codon:yes stop_codon:yes gene_type:complete
MTSTSATTPGTLYIVATPIGNRGDITFRAVEILNKVDVILAEDTRHSKQLLSSLGVQKPMQSLHAHNEAEKSEHLLKSLLNGTTFALISDAGTPLINDPGFPLVNLARKNEISVVPIPGACAFIAALSAAGIPSDAFTFSGFLPAKKSARQNVLESLKPLMHTLIFYESTHRIVESLSDIAEVFGPDCQLVLAKELTKTFERFVSGRCIEVKEWLMKDNTHQKGEFVLMIPARDDQEERQDHSSLLDVLLQELPLKQAVKIAVKLTGENKNTLYKIALERK